MSETKLTPCLWFDSQAEEAARYYTGIFKNSKIGSISRYTEAGQEVHHRPAGSVMTVEFELNVSCLRAGANNDHFWSLRSFYRIRAHAIAGESPGELSHVSAVPA